MAEKRKSVQKLIRKKHAMVELDKTISTPEIGSSICDCSRVIV